MAAIGDCAGTCLPGFVERLNGIIHSLSVSEKNDIYIRCGVWGQGRDQLFIAIDSITFLASGTVCPVKIHRHVAAANSRFTGIVVN